MQSRIRDLLISTLHLLHDRLHFRQKKCHLYIFPAIVNIVLPRNSHYPNRIHAIIHVVFNYIKNISEISVILELYDLQ